MELDGELVKETEYSLLIKVGPQELYVPKVCCSEWKELPDHQYQFVIQKDYLEFKLRRLQETDLQNVISTIQAELLQETDRAYLMKYEGLEIWFPKRAVIEARDLGERWEFVIATDFWMFKIEKQVS